MHLTLKVVYKMWSLSQWMFNLIQVQPAVIAIATPIRTHRFMTLLGDNLLLNLDDLIQICVASHKTVINYSFMQQAITYFFLIWHIIWHRQWAACFVSHKKCVSSKVVIRSGFRVGICRFVSICVVYQYFTIRYF